MYRFIPRFRRSVYAIVRLCGSHQLPGISKKRSTSVVATSTTPYYVKMLNILRFGTNFSWCVPFQHLEHQFFHNNQKFGYRTFDWIQLLIFFGVSTVGSIAELNRTGIGEDRSQSMALALAVGLTLSDAAPGGGGYSLIRAI